MILNSTTVIHVSLNAARLINKTPKTFTHGIKEGQSQTFKGHGRLLKENQNEEEKK